VVTRARYQVETEFRRARGLGMAVDQRVTPGCSWWWPEFVADIVAVSLVRELENSGVVASNPAQARVRGTKRWRILCSACKTDGGVVCSLAST
jgi:hypothetical protein